VGYMHEGVSDRAVRLPLDLPQIAVHACGKDCEDKVLGTVHCYEEFAAGLGGTYTSQTRLYAVWVVQTINKSYRKALEYCALGKTASALGYLRLRGLSEQESSLMSTETCIS
jgi:hypothetical protein